MPFSLDAVEIDSDIARALSLPATFYTAPSVLQLEREKIFGKTWQVVGHRHQLVNPGDFFTTELHGEPLLLVRSAQGELRAFYNVCRHRAGPPAEGCGSRKLFRCGYHGWTYGLDGSLIAAPELEGQPDFHSEQFSLVPVRAEEWFNLIFVNLDPNAAGLLESLGELPKQAGRFHSFVETLQATSLQGMRLFQRRTYEMGKCNWKTYVDNYLEGYHLPSVHPGLNRVSGLHRLYGRNIRSPRAAIQPNSWGATGRRKSPPLSGNS